MIIVKEVRIKFDRFYHDTGKAILIGIGRKEHWLPKYLCKNITVNKKLKGHVCLPVSICDEKGIYWDESDATVKIEKHIPDKIEITNPIPDKDLKR
ncbi:MAG: hypothetical protein CL843_09265 [Crocinitomicaceae bacterium]|nr:hypothetical protein [Crocinitomicaceae bacterium]|tara:strand:+ start:73 stop:360 length:288 start_codon:yes stop_codon:yes gene_type:complete